MYEVISKSWNVELAECWSNIALHRDMSPRGVLMKVGLLLI